jgi:hypothetical protein
MRDTTKAPSDTKPPVISHAAPHDRLKSETIIAGSVENGPKKTPINELYDSSFRRVNTALAPIAACQMPNAAPTRNKQTSPVRRCSGLLSSPRLLDSLKG